jgi:hypothetical protein
MTPKGDNPGLTINHSRREVVASRLFNAGQEKEDFFEKICYVKQQSRGKAIIFQDLPPFPGVIMLRCGCGASRCCDSGKFGKARLTLSRLKAQSGTGYR